MRVRVKTRFSESVVKTSKDVDVKYPWTRNR